MNPLINHFPEIYLTLGVILILNSIRMQFNEIGPCPHGCSQGNDD